MNLTREELVTKLPNNKDFWFATELAEALGVTKRTVQRTAKRCNIGRKVRHGPYGTYIFQYCDLTAICTYIYGEVGNPVNIAINRRRKR